MESFWLQCCARTAEREDVDVGEEEDLARIPEEDEDDRGAEHRDDEELQQCRQQPRRQVHRVEQPCKRGGAEGVRAAAINTGRACRAQGPQEKVNRSEARPGRVRSKFGRRGRHARAPIMRIVCLRRSSFSSTSALVSCETGKSWHMVITRPSRKPTAEKKMFCSYLVCAHAPQRQGMPCSVRSPHGPSGIFDLTRCTAAKAWVRVRVHISHRGVRRTHKARRGWLERRGTVLGGQLESILLDERLQREEAGKVVALEVRVDAARNVVGDEVCVGHGAVVEADAVVDGGGRELGERDDGPRALVRLRLQYVLHGDSLVAVQAHGQVGHPRVARPRTRQKPLDLGRVRREVEHAHGEDVAKRARVVVPVREAVPRAAREPFLCELADGEERVDAHHRQRPVEQRLDHAARVPQHGR
eukprot:7389447-Prymnesium_polylepis.2